MAKTARKARAARAAGGAANAALPDLRNLRDLQDLPDLPDLPALGGLPSADEHADLPPISADASSPAGVGRVAGARGSENFVTNARDGLRLRAGPDTSFAVKTTLPLGTPVLVIGREGLWAQVDLEGDGVADGFVLASLLRSAAEAARPAASAGDDILDRVTPELVASIFHPQTPLGNIRTHLPFVRAGLRAQALGDKSMVLMALGTIRAETEGFRPIDEMRSRFNTARTPFDLYDAGTSIGRRLGNTVAGDGPKFKGRGFVQLTGRDNYTKIGAQLGQPLVSNPALANDPTIAGLILATFLKNKERAIRAAIAGNDLLTARKLVNGGSHGFPQFKDTFTRGLRAF